VKARRDINELQLDFSGASCGLEVFLNDLIKFTWIGGLCLSGLKIIPKEIDQLKKLENLTSLSIQGNFPDLPGNLGEVRQIETLMIDGFKGKSVPAEILLLPKLRFFRLENCPAKFPFSTLLGATSNIFTLQVKNCGIESLPAGILENVKNLIISKCTNLSEIDSAVWNPSLKTVELFNCGTITFPAPLPGKSPLRNGYTSSDENEDSSDNNENENFDTPSSPTILSNGKDKGPMFFLNNTRLRKTSNRENLDITKLVRVVNGMGGAVYVDNQKFSHDSLKEKREEQALLRFAQRNSRRASMREELRANGLLPKKSETSGSVTLSGKNEDENIAPPLQSYANEEGSKEH
jgi:hypothetical protein